MAAVRARIAPAGAVVGGRRQSLRALRLEQIAIWGAAAHAESRGFEQPFAERRASLWERESGSRRTRDRAARRSLVLLDGDRPRRNAAPIDDDAPARPVIVREALEDSDDASSLSGDDDFDMPLAPDAPDAAPDKRAATRAKSAVRPPPVADDGAHPRARSFFEERRAPGSERSAFARAKASIRFLGRYSRSGSARIPLFRPRDKSAKDTDR